MKIFQLSLFTLISVGTAFHLEPVLLRTVATKLQASMPMDDQKNAGKIMYRKQDFRMKEPDLERAKDCVEHFGKCSVSEMQELRDGLHQKRIQEVIFGDNLITASTSSAPEDLFQERLLEEELNLQLNLLQHEMPPPYLFTPKDHPFDGSDETGTALEAQVKAAEREHVFEELVEDGALESLAICALISLFLIAPQFFLS